MGCTQSSAAMGSMGPVGSPSIVKEEHVELALRQKRRARNVFTESIELRKDFHRRVVPKDQRTRRILAQAMESNFIFATLQPDEKECFVDAMEMQNVAFNTNLIVQGDRGDYLYVVEEGRFAFIVDGKQVGECAAGSCFGELALLYNTPRAATVRSLTEAVVWKLDRLTFRYQLANNAQTQKDQTRATLSKVPLLQGLTPDQLERISDAVELVTYKEGETIIHKGQEGNVFYMIHEGVVQVKDVGLNNQFDDHELRSGDYFGERALLLDEPRAANVVASTRVVVMALDRESFHTLLGPLKELLDYNLNMRVLKSIKLFQKLTAQEKDVLAKSFIHQIFPAGETIIRQGDEGDKFYIIKEGTAKVLQRLENDIQQVKEVAELTTGDYFGEMALLNNEVRKATVVSITEVETFFVDRTVFNRELGPLQDILDRNQLSRIQTLVANQEAATSASQISLRDLNQSCLLGTGTFGRVYLMQHKQSNQVFALKTMLKSKIIAHHQTRNVLQEKDVMMMCNHPFILRLYATFKDERRLYLLLEFVQGGELWNILHTETKDGVPVSHARFYAAGVIHALAHLHAHKIAYRDMKPENCLIDREGYPKIADFGFAKVVDGKTYTLCGTPEYLAPEIVLGRGHNRSVDYWALGILLYEMVAGYSPFSDPEMNDQMTICKNIVHMPLRFPSSFDPMCKDLIRKLLLRDDSRRLGTLLGGANDIMGHHFFQEVDFDALTRRDIPAPWVPNIKGDMDVSNFEPQDEEEHDVDEDQAGYVVNPDWDADF